MVVFRNLCAFLHKVLLKTLLPIKLRFVYI